MLFTALIFVLYLKGPFSNLASTVKIDAGPLTQSRITAALFGANYWPGLKAIQGVKRPGYGAITIWSKDWVYYLFALTKKCPIEAPTLVRG